MIKSTITYDNQHGPRGNFMRNYVTYVINDMLSIALNDGNKELNEFYTQVYPIEQYPKLTHWSQVKMAAILETTFSNSSTNCFNFDWNLTEIYLQGSN